MKPKHGIGLLNIGSNRLLNAVGSNDSTLTPRSAELRLSGKMKLKMAIGIGWHTLLLLIIFIGLAFVSSGIVRWFFVVLSLLVGQYTIWGLVRWNQRGWRSIHHRSMLAYAAIAGAEAGLTNQEGREFDVAVACAQLAKTLKLKGVMGIRRSCASGSRECGAYMAALLEQHIERLIPTIRPEHKQGLLTVTREIKPGPQFVITKAVEARYGPIEAAKYVLALLWEEAK